MKGRGRGEVEVEVSLERETIPQGECWELVRRGQEVDKKRTEDRGQAKLKLLAVRADGMVEEDDDGGEGRGGEMWEEKHQDLDREPEPRRRKSWLEQQRAKSWGVGPATFPGQADFGGEGGSLEQ